MGKENIIICLDNSEIMRNGDYTPTRFDAQHGAVNLLVTRKRNMNRETQIGILTMGGRNPVVVTSLTTSDGVLRATTAKIKVEGFINFSQSVKIAQLAVKKSGQYGGSKRIIVFVGSAIEEEEKELVTLGKRLKKNNIAIDIVNFGAYEENIGKLTKLVEAANKSDNSALLTVAPGSHILSDMLVTSPIVQRSDGSEHQGTGNVNTNANNNNNNNNNNANTGGGGGGMGGFNPNEDPELAEALRLSREQYEREQQQKSKEMKDEEKGDEEEHDDDDDDHVEDDEDDDELQRAIQMSLMADSGETPKGKMKDEDEDEDDEGNIESSGEDEDLYAEEEPSKSSSGKKKKNEMKDEDEDEDEDEDAELQKALLISLQGSKSDEQKEEKKENDFGDILDDEDFLDGVLDDLSKKKDKKDEKKKE